MKLLRATLPGPALLLSAALLLAGCDESLTEPKSSSSQAPGAASQTQKANPPGNGASGLKKDVVTSNPKRFAEALQAIGNENEVNVALKNESAPRITKSQLGGGEAVTAVAVPKTKGNAKRRTSGGFASSSESAYRGLMTSLKARGVEPYRARPGASIMSLRIPDEKLTSVLATLMGHPNVDYIDANQSRRVYFDSGSAVPSRIAASAVKAMSAPANGSSSTDIKHTFHKVLEAWDYTRGEDVKVGILDTGFAYDRQGTEEYHPDGERLGYTKGIKKIGFVDDYSDLPEYDLAGDPWDCDQGYEQERGECMPWDDFPGSPGGHGTHMAGLVGANDNDQGYVGTMPEGLTVSMKIAHNEHITRGDHDGRVDKIEEDDFYWAVDWATRNGIDVLSMSFTSEWDKTIVNVLDAAYNRDDILLLSSTGNTKGDAYNDPQEESAVMGVGGLNSEGESIFVEEDEEVSGLSGGGTLDAYCPSPDRWCEPSGRDFYDPYYYDYDREEYIGQGGTSASTAIAAGIAGLVRAHNPNMSASEVRQRLVNTADGPHNKLNAAEAVTGN